MTYISIIWGIVYTATGELVAWSGDDIWAVIFAEYAQ